MAETQTLTLTHFLLARIAEDGDTELLRLANMPIGIRLPEPPPFNRVLAECEAKRRIVEYSKRAASLDPESPAGQTALEAYGLAMGDALCALALPYADHPDYRDEWKP